MARIREKREAVRDDAADHLRHEERGGYRQDDPQRPGAPRAVKVCVTAARGLMSIGAVHGLTVPS